MSDAQTPWTPDVVALFHALLAEQPKLTYRQIAARLNEMNGWFFTKNACIGYGRRIGVPKRQPPRSYAGRKGRTLKPRTRPRVPKLRLPPRLTEPQPSKRIDKVLIENLEPGDCRWPYGDRVPYLFCGRPQIEGSSYCFAHTRKSCPSFLRRR